MTKSKVKIKKEMKHHKPTIKKDGYEMHYGHEIQEMMGDHMRKAVGIKKREGDLNNGKVTPKNEHADECAKHDAKKAYKRAGLNKKSGADNDKESLEVSRKIGVKTKKRK